MPSTAEISGSGSRASTASVETTPGSPRNDELGRLREEARREWESYKSTRHISGGMLSVAPGPGAELAKSALLTRRQQAAAAAAANQSSATLGTDGGAKVGTRIDAADLAGLVQSAQVDVRNQSPRSSSTASNISSLTINTCNRSPEDGYVAATADLADESTRLLHAVSTRLLLSAPRSAPPFKPTPISAEVPSEASRRRRAQREQKLVSLLGNDLWRGEGVGRQRARPLSLITPRQISQPLKGSQAMRPRHLRRATEDLHAQIRPSLPLRQRSDQGQDFEGGVSRSRSLIRRMRRPRGEAHSDVEMGGNGGSTPSSSLSASPAGREFAVALPESGCPKKAAAILGLPVAPLRPPAHPTLASASLKPQNVDAVSLLSRQTSMEVLEDDDGAHEDDERGDTQAQAWRGQAQDAELREERRRRVAKISRWLGAVVPAHLVSPGAEVAPAPAYDEQQAPVLGVVDWLSGRPNSPMANGSEPSAAATTFGRARAILGRRGSESSVRGTAGPASAGSDSVARPRSQSIGKIPSPAKMHVPSSDGHALKVRRATKLAHVFGEAPPQGLFDGGGIRLDSHSARTCAGVSRAPEGPAAPTNDAPWTPISSPFEDGAAARLSYEASLNSLEYLLHNDTALLSQLMEAWNEEETELPSLRRRSALETEEPASPTTSDETPSEVSGGAPRARSPEPYDSFLSDDSESEAERKDSPAQHTPKLGQSPSYLKWQGLPSDASPDAITLTDPDDGEDDEASPHRLRRARAARAKKLSRFFGERTLPSQGVDEAPTASTAAAAACHPYSSWRAATLATTDDAEEARRGEGIAEGLRSGFGIWRQDQGEDDDDEDARAIRPNVAQPPASARWSVLRPRAAGTLRRLLDTIEGEVRESPALDDGERTELARRLARLRPQARAVET